MKPEDMPVLVEYTRRCRCGTRSKSFELYAPCPSCRQKDQFASFKSEGLGKAWDRAVRLAATLRE